MVDSLSIFLFMASKFGNLGICDSMKRMCKFSIVAVDSLEIAFFFCGVCVYCPELVTDLV
jgi:hypothetical protein